MLARIARVVQWEHIGMRELCDRLDLAQKAIRAERLGELWSQDLDRHAAAMSEVLGQIHDRHPAATKLALESIAVANGLLDAALQIVHYRPRWWADGVQDGARAENPRGLGDSVPQDSEKRPREEKAPRGRFRVTEALGHRVSATSPTIAIKNPS